jgi:uncharacterized cysteine cluster protein YcgN (CxxCxxCC family)
VSTTPFWEKPLTELTKVEWEALCDGCGRCCLKKLGHEGSNETAYTRVICRYFDEPSCQCTNYNDRQRLVPDCVVISDVDIGQLHWMPATCAYKLRYEDRPLYDWHPLIAGSREKMNALGISVAGKVLSEDYVHEDGLEEHVITWVSCDDE